MTKLIDLTGMKFGRLTVIALDPRRVHHRDTIWRCVCDCGNEHLVLGRLLRRGRTTSCGCFRREQLIKRSTKHGHARRSMRTNIYNRWRAMRNRCFNPNNTSYPYYGGRKDGPPITVCPEYDDFLVYYRDRGDPPPGMSNDRINNDGNYEPDNLRWADSHTQRINQRPRSKTKSKQKRPLPPNPEEGVP